MKNLIIISDGHGEYTKGKRSHVFPDGYVLKENEFNRVVVDIIKDHLSKYDCEILHVSDGNDDISLKVRTDTANKRYKELCAEVGKENVNAIYVSIHANHDGGKTWSSANGIEVFKYPKSDGSYHQLALDKLIKSTKLRNRGVKEADFHELRETAMKSCLFELGFMSNLNEAELLRSDEYRKLCADVITESLVEDMKLEKKQAIPNTDETQKEVYWRVVVASNKDIEESRKLVQKLQHEGYKDAFIAKYEK